MTMITKLPPLNGKEQEDGGEEQRKNNWFHPVYSILTTKGQKQLYHGDK